MKKIIIFSTILFIGMVMLLNNPLKGNEKNLQLQKNISKGVYIPTINITITEMRNLPIPSSNENYSFLQCIDNECNVIIGKFAVGEREIILIKDKNVDNQVDLVVHWYVDTERFKFDANPRGTYSPEAFRKLKEDILKGTGIGVYPNREGMEYIQVLSQNSSNIKKWKNGYNVIQFDPDSAANEMIVYSISSSADGADLVFDVKYRYKNSLKISPVINQCVYCKNAKDTYINETVQKLLDDLRKANSE